MLGLRQPTKRRAEPLGGPLIPEPWDYLILTASSEAQAAAYRSQLAIRGRLGLLGGVRHWLVVPDPGGRRVGSGGSTVACLAETLNHRLAGRRKDLAEPHAWLETLRCLRILVIHAGGDSRRLPAYGPCGKVFVPLPGASNSAWGPRFSTASCRSISACPPRRRAPGKW